MINGSLLKYDKQIQYFMERLFNKLAQRENKYEGVGEQSTAQVYKHFLEELDEAFGFSPEDTTDFYRLFLKKAYVEKEELIDVAAMVIALYISLENDIKKEDF